MSDRSLPPYCRYITYYTAPCRHTSGTSHITLVHTTTLHVCHISHWSIPPHCMYVTYHTSPYHHTSGTSHTILVHTALLQVRHTSHWSIAPYFRYITHHPGPYFHTSGISQNKCMEIKYYIQKEQRATPGIPVNHYILCQTMVYYPRITYYGEQISYLYTLD